MAKNKRRVHPHLTTHDPDGILQELRKKKQALTKNIYHIKRRIDETEQEKQGYRGMLAAETLKMNALKLMIKKHQKTLKREGR